MYDWAECWRSWWCFETAGDARSCQSLCLLFLRFTPFDSRWTEKEDVNRSSRCYKMRYDFRFVLYCVNRVSQLFETLRSRLKCKVVYLNSMEKWGIIAAKCYFVWRDLAVLLTLSLLATCVRVDFHLPHLLTRTAFGCFSLLWFDLMHNDINNLPCVEWICL